MLLKREREDVVLYDDHGEAWKITLASPDGTDASHETEASPMDGPFAITFSGREGEPLRVPYEGAATCELELLFDEVVVHFLKSHD